MMVTAVVEASEETLAFQRIIGRLQGKQDGAAMESKTELYDSISDWFKKNDAGKMTCSEMIEMRPFVSQFSTDIMSSDTTMVQAALQAMGFCLYQAGIIRALSKEDSIMVVKALCNCLLKSDDKSVCTRALWCLAKQNMKADVIEDEVHTILCSVEKALQTEGSAKSMTVQHESVNVIIRLQEQLPENMPSHAARWGKLLLPHLLHSAPKIRERALHGVNMGLVAMVKCRAELAPALAAELKSGLVGEMTKLFKARHELCVLRVWGYYVTILGRALHKGGSLINSLLAVMELGFKHPQQEVKRVAYMTWHSLINNFSLELDVLSNAKRVKLLMQPFLATSVRQESVAHVKLDAWWHLVRALGPRLPATFEAVCAPLLQCTLGSGAGKVQGDVTPIKAGSTLPPAIQGLSTPQSRTAILPAASPVTPRLNLPSLGGAASQQVFPSVRQRGVRMLAAFLGVKQQAENGTAPIDSLPQKLLTSPSIFSKLAPILVPFVMDTLRMQDTASGELPLQIYESLVSQVKSVAEGQSKKNSVAIFTCFMNHLTAVINSRQLPPSTVLKLLDLASSLPKKVLSSSSYHTGDAGILHGTPALLLTDLLFSQTLALQSPEERFFTILMRLVECGMSSAATVLGFTQSVMAILDRVSDSVSSKEALWRIWSVMAEPLFQHIIQTNEVNQGDSLEHDFSAVTVCLLFPVTRLLPHHLSQPTVKTLLKLWSELYEAFARSASLVTIVEANQCCEDICSKLLTQLTDHDLQKWYFQAAVGHMCQVLTHNLDLSQYSDAAMGSPTPRRKGKRRSRPEGNLASLVKLVGHVTLSCANLCKTQKTTLAPSLSQNEVVHWFNAVQSLTGAASDLSRAGPASTLHAILESLSKPLAEFIRYTASPNLAKKDYLTSIEDKIERLWVDWSTAIQTRYSDSFDSSFLVIMAPLLEAAFTYQKRAVRDYTLVFWEATFGKQESLEYPEFLVPCLARVRDKSGVALPGWTGPETVSDLQPSLESEASQSAAMPLAPAVIPNFGAPSPQKMHGSFLRRPAEARKLVVASSPDKEALGSPGRGAQASGSPGRGLRASVSPGRGKLPSSSPGAARRKQFASPMAVDVAKRRLPVDEDSKVEFVVISSSASKKRVLTEHQKEVMRTKRVSLALYNDLEQSQDTQAFRDLTQQTQSQSLQPSPAISENETSAPETSRFNFSEMLGQEQPPEKQAEDETASKENVETGMTENGPVNDDTTGDKKQEKQTVPRRVVTLCQPVTQPSSPIKDAGQLVDVHDDDSCHGDEAEIGEGRESSHADSSNDVGNEGRKSEDHVTVIEDTCPDVSVEDVMSSAVLISDTDEMDVEMIGKAEELLVPETQEMVQEEAVDHNISDDITLISGGDNLDPDEAISGIIAESPCKAGDSDVEELEDILPDGHFHKVISTPVIKLQKLHRDDVEQKNEKTVEEKQAVVLSKGSSHSPERISSPTESTDSGTPVFRRYRSDEIHVRSATPKRRRRWNSDTEEAKSESKIAAPKASGDADGMTKHRNLHSSQRDLAELAERYELDGIEPLGDLDQSFEDDEPTMSRHQSEVGLTVSREISYSEGKLVDKVTQMETEEQEPTCTHESREDSESVEHVEDDMLCSQQELFSDDKENTAIALSLCHDEKAVDDSQSSVKDAKESHETSISQQEARKKRRMSRKSKIVEEPSNSQARMEVEDVERKRRKKGKQRKSEGNGKKIDKSNKTCNIHDGVPEEITNTEEKESQSTGSLTEDVTNTSISVSASKKTEIVDSKVIETIGNNSIEDIFGNDSSSVVVTQRQVQVEPSVPGAADIADRTAHDDSFSSEDDILLVDLKRSLQSKPQDEEKVISDVCINSQQAQESEDSEIDFPSLTPQCRSHKVNPNTKTPPRDVLERLPSSEDEHIDLSSPLRKRASEHFTVTRSGRKSRPSAKVKSAKGILSRALKSPEFKRSKHTGKDAHVKKISPKVLRSSVGKVSKKMQPSNRETEIGSQFSENEMTSLEGPRAVVVVNPSREDLSNYAISPKSLQTLAKKIASSMPQPQDREMEAQSPQKLHYSSPETSPVSSSQVTRSSKGPKFTNRSKSPVSLRLRAQRLCITPGPRQTRAGTKLSRVENKKKNKRRKRQSEVLDEIAGEADHIKDVCESNDVKEVCESNDVKEVCESNVDVIPDSIQPESSNVILIEDTMSQDYSEDNEHPEIMVEASQCHTVCDNIEGNREPENEKVEKSGHVENHLVDEDGDIEMMNLDDGSKSVGTENKVVEFDLTKPGSDNVEEREETENVCDTNKESDLDDKLVVISDTVEEEASPEVENDVQETMVNLEGKDGVQETPELMEAAVRQPDHDLPQTRSKRSSQRLTFDDAGPESRIPALQMEAKGIEGQEMFDKEALDVSVESESIESSDDSSQEDGDDAAGDQKEEELHPKEQTESSEDAPMAEDVETCGASAASGSVPVGIVSCGLDVQDVGEIINSSQSPTEEEGNQEPDSSSKRLAFPLLTPPEADTFTSPDKPKAASASQETQPFQVSPIIPAKFSTSMQQGSPEGACVRPVWPNQVSSPEGSIPHMYSPTASPSSGILKHKDGLACSSPSPSSKSRRVSFADKVFIEPEPLRDTSWSGQEQHKKAPDASLAADPPRLPLPPSPLVTTAASRVLARNSKYITTHSKDLSDSPKSSTSSSSLHRLRKKSAHSSRRMKAKMSKPSFLKSSYASRVYSMAQQTQEGALRHSPSQSTQGSLTQGNAASQEGSSLEVEGESQGAVYPSLAECALPVDTVLPQLTSSMWSRGLGQLVRARNIRTIGDLSSLSPMQVKSLPIKSPKISHLKQVLSSFKAQKFPDMKENQTANVDDPSTTPPRSPSPPGTEDPQVAPGGSKEPTSPPRSPQQLSGDSLVRRLDALAAEFREGALEAMPAVELFQAHSHVNSLMDAIVGALKMKCHSPSMQHDAN